MAKRIFSFSLVLALLILCVTPVLANTTMYVYTDNRKPLNVRSAPYVGDNLIATGVENIEFHPVALNRVYKNTTVA